MTHEIEILQLPAGHPMLFSDDAGLCPEHKSVYVGTFELSNKHELNMLEEVYVKFNMNRPSDFTGHSLSISDIVRLDGVDYQVSFFGFNKLS